MNGQSSDNRLQSSLEYSEEKKVNSQASKTTVIINGSPRENGNTAFVASLMERSLNTHEYTVSVIHLRELSFSGCIGCERCRKDNICHGLTDDLTPVYNKLNSAGLWIFGSPVHNYNITSWMKACIDRLYCYYNFDTRRPRGYWSSLREAEKKAVIYGIAEQTKKEDFGFTLEAMSKPLSALDITIVGSFQFYGYFDKQSLKNDPERIDRFRKKWESLIRNL